MPCNDNGTAANYTCCGGSMSDDDRVVGGGRTPSLFYAIYSIDSGRWQWNKAERT